MRKYAFIIIFLLSSFALKAANDADSLHTTSFRSAWKLDFFRAVQGTFQFTRESVLPSDWTFNAGFMGTWASTRGLAKIYLKAQNFSYSENNQIYALDEIELRGYGINLQARKYLGKHATAFKGFYAAPELFFRQLFLESTIFDYLTQTNKDIQKTLYLGYLGYLAGHQYIVRDVVSLDLYVGGGFFYSRYGNNEKPVRYQHNYQLDYTGFYFNMGILVGIIK